MSAPAGAGTMVLITRLARAIYRRSNEELLGIRLKQYVALDVLRDFPDGIGQGSLGDLLQLDANNLVLLLNELEANGHIERRRDPGDRRRHIVELTRAGRQALERAERGMESVEAEVLAGLAPDERARLLRLLRDAVAANPG
jgi:DNA-binding MarR family transcriptional regulator